VREPDQLLRDIRGRIRPGGTLVTSVPNFGHWYPRLRVAAGRFDYDRRGILDRGHLRFFTRRSFETLLAATGFEVCRRDVVGLPVEVSSRGAGDSDPISGGARATGALDRVAVDAWPTLFGYQFIYEVTAKRDL
jgi:hypothetical protein